MAIQLYDMEPSQDKSFPTAIKTQMNCQIINQKLNLEVYPKVRSENHQDLIALFLAGYLSAYKVFEEKDQLVPKAISFLHQQGMIWVDDNLQNNVFEGSF